MARVTAPVKDFAGEVVGVTFEKGVGETDDDNLLAYFRRHGYDVAGKPAKKAAAKPSDK